LCGRLKWTTFDDLFQKIIPILISGNIMVAGIDMNNINPEIILKLLIYGFEAPDARLNIPLFTDVREFITGTSTTRFSIRPQ
jgi:hypothetical protein